MIIGIPKEVYAGERRVAISPDSAARILKLGYEIVVESQAGAEANFSDRQYEEAGAKICDNARACYEQADIIAKIRPPEESELSMLKDGTTLISFIYPGQNEELVQKLAAKKMTVLGLDCVPRISRAQKLDALSSMANIAGYRAVIEAAHHFGRFFTGQVTAAGKVPPAKVLVIGAGVAGLSAIGTAKSLGAIVRAFDTRSEVKEQIESMGGEFLTVEIEEDGSGSGGYAKVMSQEFIDAEMALFREQAKDIDIVITTALIPGKPAPKLVNPDMLDLMAEGSVVVDLAAEQGGNCFATKAGEVTEYKGVKVIGYADLPSRLPQQSSRMLGANFYHLLDDMTKERDGQLVLNMDDVVARGTTVVHQGEKIWPPPALEPSPTPKSSATPAAATPVIPQPKPASKVWTYAGLLLAGYFGYLVARYAPANFLGHLTVFVLSCFIGWQVIWNVTPALHTPLMSVTNAISGIIIIGALVQIDTSSTSLSIGLAAIAAFLAMINVSGGFLVTQRMLKMFRRD